VGETSVEDDVGLRRWIIDEGKMVYAVVLGRGPIRIGLDTEPWIADCPGILVEVPGIG
jgi:hypothetical protein